MSKTEFLAELAKHLQVLEESEQQDILAEYAQHIDMKMEGGLSEAEAIRDFGPIRELAADILTAYHVRPDYSPQEEKGRGIKGPDLDKVKEKSKQAAGAVGRQAGRFTTWFRRGWGKFRAALSRLAAKIRNRDRKAKEPGRDLSPKEPGRWGRRFRRAVRAVGSGTLRLFRWAGRVIATLARWCWNVLCACGTVVLGLGSLMALFAFGLLLVWMIQGYPFVGLTLGTLGLTLALGALSLLCSTLIAWKQRRETPKVAIWEAKLRGDDPAEESRQPSWYDVPMPEDYPVADVADDEDCEGEEPEDARETGADLRPFAPGREKEPSPAEEEEEEEGGEHHG